MCSWWFVSGNGLVASDKSFPQLAFMRHWIGSSLVHVMACRLFGAKPLPEPMMAYVAIKPLGISVNFCRKQNICNDKIAFENVVCQSGGQLVPASSMCWPWTIWVDELVIRLHTVIFCEMLWRLILGFSEWLITSIILCQYIYLYII